MTSGVLLTRYLMKDQRKQLIVRMPPQMHRDLKEKAAKLGVSMTDLALAVLRTFLEATK